MFVFMFMFIAHVMRSACSECMEQLASAFVELAVGRLKSTRSEVSLCAAAREKTPSEEEEEEEVKEKEKPESERAEAVASASEFHFERELLAPLTDERLESLARWLTYARRRVSPALGEHVLELCLSRLRRERLRPMRRVRKALHLRTRWRITTRIRLMQHGVELSAQQRTDIFEIFARELGARYSQSSSDRRLIFFPSLLFSSPCFPSQSPAPAQPH